MSTRSKAIKDSLLCSPDPVRLAIKIRKELREEARQSSQQTETLTSSLMSNMATQGGNENGSVNGNGHRELGNVEVPQRRRTLGEFTQYQGPRHYAIIVMLPRAKAIEINPTLLNYLNAHLSILLRPNKLRY